MTNSAAMTKTHPLGKLARAKIALEITDAAGLLNNPISGTIGRLDSPRIAMILGTTAPFKPGASSDDEALSDVIDSLKDMPELSDVHLSLGGTTPIDNLSRVWDNKNLSLPGKLFGTLVSPMIDYKTALSRADHYNPYANTVTLFNSDPATLRHELGHAIDFKRKESPILYTLARTVPGVTLYQEAKASGYASDDAAKVVQNALDSEDTDGLAMALEDVRRTNRVLGGGFGSYVGSALGGVAGSIAGAKYGPKILNSIKMQRPMQPRMKPIVGRGIGQAVGSTGGAVLGALIGQLIGKYTQPFLTGESRETYGRGLEVLDSQE